jgi:hypothetical protein
MPYEFLKTSKLRTFEFFSFREIFLEGAVVLGVVAKAFLKVHRLFLGPEYIFS